MTSDLRYSGFVVGLLAALSCFQALGYSQGLDGQAFDYADYAEVLKAYVDENGMVDYQQLKARPQRLSAYVKAIATLPRPRYLTWDDRAKIAFWLNAYNGLTLKAIIDNYPIKASFLKSRIYPKNSIRQIPGIWDKIKFTVMGRQVLRVEFNEPRIHMAMVCAALGCPPLRNEPYLGSRLDEQLDDQTRNFLGHRQKLRIDRGKGLVYLSPIFKWFKNDFVRTGASAGNVGRHGKEMSSVLSFIARYLDEADGRYVRAGDFKVKYLDYDWSLNEQKR